MNKGKAEVQRKAQALERLTVQYVPHDRITPNDYNPNRQSEHDFELLTRSMREDGFTQPIVAVEDPDHEDKFVIVDGEHRWRAAMELGMAEVPIVVVPMTPEQARIATLRHNRARGSEDIELTAQVLRDLQQLGALDWAQDSLLLDDVEINRLLDEIPVPEALAGEEYTEAWVPAGTDDPDAQSATATPDLDSADSHQNLRAMTPAAVAAVRKREVALREAKTEEQREMVRKDSELFRLSLMFTGNEARIVKDVLGERPAEKLMQLCVNELPYERAVP
jgi:ParB-like chromosome segregation protein Spo0J